MEQYNKLALDTPDLLAMLKQRGLVINNEQAALKTLSVISYFRLACYFRPMEFDKLPIGKKGSCTASKSGSMQGYGHTGFTGTFVWADPANKTVIVFLSNRVYPDTEPNKLARTGVRTALHDILYEAYPVE